jgi:hypothetical protein
VLGWTWQAPDHSANLVQGLHKHSVPARQRSLQAGGPSDGPAGSKGSCSRAVLQLRLNCTARDNHLGPLALMLWFKG